MKKHILLIYYSQTGQGKAIADSVLAPLSSEDLFVLDTYEIKPHTDYPFPWTSDAFFDAMPESVEGLPCKIEEPPSSLFKEYDLVLLVFPVWYLSPAIPVASFLQSEAGRTILAGKKVITLSGLRNMGVSALEDLRRYLELCNANLIGNIALRDTNNNLVSVLTIIRWLMKGKKEASGRLPEAGVKQADIDAAAKFGEIIKNALWENDFIRFNDKLLNAGSNNLNYAVMNMELKAKKIFKIWSKFILKKGKAGDRKRLGRVRAFKYYLLTVIFLLSPVAGLIFKLKKMLFPKIALKQTDYYKAVGKREK